MVRPSARRPVEKKRDRGFTLIELVAVIGLVTMMCGIVYGSFQTLTSAVRGDSEMRAVQWQLKLARQAAISEHRAIEIRFQPPNIIKLVRHDTENGTTVLSTIDLGPDARFLTFSGQPDTPDAFGRASAVSFGSATRVMFTADGRVVDQDGKPVNGSVFIGQPGHPGSSRALTVFGQSARIRAYRWTNAGWKP